MDPLKPKKHLGQHFLADENTARKIVDLLQAPPGAAIVEIGPGMGVLTKYLLERFSQVHVVEFDPAAVAYLQQAYGDKGLHIHQADFLKWEFSEHLGGPAHFIGNLPYNVSSPIFFKLLEERAWVKEAVFMVQKEVADRVCAPESAETKQKGILSVLVSRYFHAKTAFKVKPSVFRPPPKVMSGVFRMEALPDPGPPAFPLFKAVVKAAFGKRRKTLRNALRELEVPWEQLPADWPGLRAEALPYAAFAQISNTLKPSTEDA